MGIQNARRAPTYCYRCSYVVESIRPKSAGATNGSELPFVFTVRTAASPLCYGSWSDRKAAPSADLAVKMHLHACWITFANAGESGGPRFARLAALFSKHGRAHRSRDGLRAFALTSERRSTIPSRRRFLVGPMTALGKGTDNHDGPVLAVARSSPVASTATILNTGCPRKCPDP